ncbi:hypothetical protein [Pseudohongiella spirulinae]|uniref:Uncharacterized protein n=1 Tax=Pseudohongiella spirulinae TaxID=1249552 RepID=A0A0S2K947_9GAMM|nr:hypothetical protein [Pseudohongiella spirulinae]ALO44761.1 hypothetical protein PS2015_63 [Pseudohongiella spirulinae]
MNLTVEKLRLRLIMCLIITMTALPVSATTVMQMNFDDVVQKAQLVFEGRVMSVESRQTGPRAIHTIITFQILDVVKGDYEQSTIELSYLGGKVGNREMWVAEMQMPAVGENGIYFVGNPGESMIHPLVGWSQGHYRIERNSSGVAGVTTAQGRAVTGIGATSMQPMTVLPEGAAARGVQAQALRVPEAVMTPAAFKSRVRQIHQQQIEEPLP